MNETYPNWKMQGIHQDKFLKIKSFASDDLLKMKVN